MDRARWTVTCEIRPRFRDTDAMGHINNAVYITYLEVGRQAYWAEFDKDSDYRRVPFTLARVECDFRTEALVKEVLEVGIRCSRIGTRSFAFEYVIREKTTDRVVVEASTVQVCYDYATKSSLPVPDEMRRRLEAFEGRPLSSKAPA